MAEGEGGGLKGREGGVCGGGGGGEVLGVNCFEREVAALFADALMY